MKVLVKNINKKAETSKNGYMVTWYSVAGVDPDDINEAINYRAAGFTKSGELVKSLEVGKAYEITLEESNRGWTEWVDAKSIDYMYEDQLDDIAPVKSIDPTDPKEKPSVEDMLKRVNERRLAKQNGVQNV